MAGEGDKQTCSRRPNNSLNKFMHPRNPYRTPPSFKQMASSYPEFRKYCVYELDGKVHLNFKNPKALCALTTCLLEKDFGLKMKIPDDRLVPTLPLRLNYLLWIEDLMALRHQKSSSQTIVGIDIGTGASCIYPLLAAKKNHWSMIASEADSVNFSCAQKNVLENNLDQNILVTKVMDGTIYSGLLDDELVKCFAMARHASAPINPAKEVDIAEATMNVDSDSTSHVADTTVDNAQCALDREDHQQFLFDFTMCNPPFFATEEAADSMTKSKNDNRSQPNNAATGSLHERVTTGGEVEFISKMINESLLFKEKVRVFTSMVGTKDDLQTIKQVVQNVNPTHYTVNEFCQGRTMRWGIAWTFMTDMPLESILSKKKLMEAKPVVLIMPRSCMSEYSVMAAWRMIHQWLRQLKVNVRIFKSGQYFVGANIKAYKASWLHQRRKIREEISKKKSSGPHVNGGELIQSKEAISSSREMKRKNYEDENKHGDVVGISPKRQKGEEFDEESQNLSHVSVNSETETGIESKTPDSSFLDTSENLKNVDESPTAAISKLGKLSLGEPAKNLPCLLQCRIQVKQDRGQVCVELLRLGGLLGKDGVNQLAQYMKNHLTIVPK